MEANGCCLSNGSIILEFILTTSAVQIDFLGHELICTFPNCEDITLHCSGSEEGVEWINTDNFLINSTQTARIHSKKLHTL